MDSIGYHLRGNEDHFSARSIEDDDQNRADGYSKKTKTIYLSAEKRLGLYIDGILLPQLFWPTVRKKCSSDQEKNLRSLEQFIQTVKGQNNF